MRPFGKTDILSPDTRPAQKQNMPLRPRILSLVAALALAAAPALAVSTQATAQAIRLGPSPAGAYLAARAAELRSDLVSAARFYEVVLSADPTNFALATRVLSLWIEAGVIENAVPLAEQIVEGDPGYEPARLTLAVDAFQREAYPEVEDQLAAIAGDSFSDLSVALLTAWAQIGQGDVDTAIQGLEEVSAETEMLAGYHSALMADFAGRTDEALSILADIYNPDQTQRVVEAYARMLARSGQTDLARTVIDDFLADVPDHPLIGELLRQIDAGEDIAPMIQSPSEGAAEVLYGLASSLVAGDQFNIAISYLQLSRTIGPGTELPTVLLGQLLQAQARHAEAVEVLDSIADESPYAVPAAISASISDASRGEEQAAIDRLVPIAAADPTLVSATEALATIYRSEMRWQDADDVLSASIDALPSINERHWRLFYQRGIASERMGEWDEAERDFERALVLSPGEPDVLNYLGYSWLERDENYLEAFEMIQQAAEQRPQSGYIVDSLGWAYYKLGQYESAVSVLERAVELTPDKAEILEHLGDAMWRAGRQVEARFQWNHALQYDADEAMVERIERKLEDGLEPLPDGMPAEGIMEIN